MTRPCRYCDADVYLEVDRLVDVRSGNIGGTYDWCDLSPDNRHHHTPRQEPVVKRIVDGTFVPNTVDPDTFEFSDAAVCTVCEKPIGHSNDPERGMVQGDRYWEAICSDACTVAYYTGDDREETCSTCGQAFRADDLLLTLPLTQPPTLTCPACTDAARHGA